MKKYKWRGINYSSKIDDWKTLCGYSIATIWAFDLTENKHTLYREKDCMKKLCEPLREHAKNKIDF